MPLKFIAPRAKPMVSLIKKLYGGSQKHSEAEKIVRSAQHRYEMNKVEFDKQAKKTTLALDTLEKIELEIIKNLREFKLLTEKLLPQLNSERQYKLELNTPKHKLQIQNHDYTAIKMLGFITAGAGVASSFTILGAPIATPVLLIAAWAHYKHEKKSLENAKKADREINEAIIKLYHAIRQLRTIETYVFRIEGTLTTLYSQFSTYFDRLKEIDSYLSDLKGTNIDVQIELAKFGDDITRPIENGYALASILVDIITTPIFKLKKVNGRVVKNSENIPEVEKDVDGLIILNDSELNTVLIQAESDAG